MLRQEFSEKRETFLQYCNAGEVEGEVIPKQQLDNMGQRFDRLSIRLNELHTLLTYEEMKQQLLLNLAEVDARLEMWHSKYCSEDSVTRMLTDYQVCIFAAVTVVSFRLSLPSSSW